MFKKVVIILLCILLAGSSLLGIITILLGS